MRYQLYTLFTILILLSSMIYLGYHLYGAILFFCSIYAILRNNREITFLCCLGWGGLFISLLIHRQIPVIFIISFPVMILAQWEMMGVQRLSRTFPHSSYATDAKVKRVSLYLTSIFLVALCSYLILSSFYLAMPLLFVVILVFLFLLLLYIFVAKDL